MPTQPTAHGREPRGLESVPRSVSYDGRFGRMFRQLPPFKPDVALLTKLAETMIEPDVDVEKDLNAPSNSSTIPAGFTYFGQFVDHDLTLDTGSSLDRDTDPDGLQNMRTPRFDLDSVYGKGPDDSPQLYSRDRLKLLIGKNTPGTEDDLPRTDAGVGLLGDGRNDENLIVSQLHLAFLKFHNKVVDELAAKGLSGATLFQQAQRTVRWHYQWIVLRDFLPRIVGQKVIDDILRKDDDFNVAVGTGVKSTALWRTELKFFDWKKKPFMPVEFSVASYRFGHSMVRGDYALNEATAEDEVPIFDREHPGDPNARDLRGSRFRPAGMQIEWFRFFEFPGQEEPLQPARAIDTQLVFPLGGLPVSVVTDPPTSLAARNLIRGLRLGLPSGQAVARAMGLPESLIVSVDNSKYKFQIGTGYKLSNGQPDPSLPPISPADKTALETAFGRETPLWYYILKEAELITGGETLGPVGGRIVAEVFIGLMFGDIFSFLQSWPNWEPKKGQFGCPKDGQFRMTDLLKFVQ